MFPSHTPTPIPAPPITTDLLYFYSLACLKMELAYGMHSFVSSFFHSVWCFLRSFMFRRFTAAQYSIAQIHPYLFIHLQVYGHLDFSRLRKLGIKLISTFASISFIFKCSFHLRQSFAMLHRLVSNSWAQGIFLSQPPK